MVFRFLSAAEPPRENFEKFTQRMDDRIGLDGLSLLIWTWPARRLKDDPKRKPGPFTADHIP